MNQIIINESPTPSTLRRNRTATYDRHKKTTVDTDSVHSLEPLRKKWMISSANCDYNSLVLYLKEDPELSGYKDFTNGYTALHWAAKFAKPEIIDLIAGRHNVSPNIKNFSGYTPLHLAAISQNEQIMELLINTYNADPEIRDISGKKAIQYLTNKSTNTSSASQTTHKPLSSPSVIRSASLKAAARIREITGIGQKSLSEENLRKKSKTNSKRYPSPERVRRDLETDSDSDYVFD